MADFDFIENDPKRFGGMGIGKSEGWSANQGVKTDFTQPQTPVAPTNNAPLIPPELQSIIDKVAGSSMSVGRKGEQLTHLAGVIGGLVQNRTNEQGATRRLGISENNQTVRLGQIKELDSKRLGLEEQKLEWDKKTGSPLSGQDSKRIRQGMGDTSSNPYTYDYFKSQVWNK